jgi:L-malate glycosyltransferase
LPLHKEQLESSLDVRILHINSSRSVGGGERHLIDLVNGLVDHSNEIYLALPLSSPLHLEFTSFPDSNILNIGMRNALDVSSALRLSHFIKEKRIELVHAHLARDYPLAAFATRRTGNIPLVLTRHVLFKLSRLHSLLFTSNTHFIAVSESVAKRLRDQKLVSKDRITTIHNGIDVDRFNLSDNRIVREDCRRRLPTKAKFLVGTVGHLSSIKGMEEFIRAAAIVLKKRKDVEFIIVGEDKSRKKENRRAIEQLINRLSLENHIHLTGWVDDVLPIYLALDIFVSTARVEPFGLAIVEAMASKLPVIATRSEGALEIIKENQTGRLIPINDADVLAESIIELLDNEMERKRLGEEAQRSAREEFSKERMIKDTEQFYRSILLKDKS